LFPFRFIGVHPGALRNRQRKQFFEVPVKLADENAARRAAEIELAASHRNLEGVVERRTAELRRSEERLKLFIKHAPAAIAMFDRDIRYLSVSQRWLEDYRIGGQDLVGRSHYEVFPELPERWKEFHRCGLAGEMLHAMEDRFERMDGPEQWVKWDLLPWRTQSGGASAPRRSRRQ
jgi:PAS domain S-box-containing protein